MFFSVSYRTWWCETAGNSLEVVATILKIFKNAASFWMMIFTPTKMMVKLVATNRTKKWWPTTSREFLSPTSRTHQHQPLEPTNTNL